MTIKQFLLSLGHVFFFFFFFSKLVAVLNLKEKGLKHKLAFVIFPLKKCPPHFHESSWSPVKTVTAERINLFTKRQHGKFKKKKILLFLNYKSNNFLWELSQILLTHNSTSWNWKFLSTFNFFLSFLCHCVCYLFRICLQKFYIFIIQQFSFFSQLIRRPNHCMYHVDLKIYFPLKFWLESVHVLHCSDMLLLSGTCLLTFEIF